MTILYKIGALLPTLASTMTTAQIAELSNLLQTLAIVAFAVGALALIGSVVIWVKLDIKNVIGFLSGKNAQKAIEALLTGKQTYKGKSKGVRPSEPAGNPQSGYSAGETTPLQDTERTELLDKSRRGAPPAGGGGEETELLGSRRGGGEETELLGSRQGTGEETELLDRTVRSPQTQAGGFDEDSTMLLTREPTAPPEPVFPGAPSPMDAPSPRQLNCEDTQILTSVWDEEIDIDL